MKNIDKRCVDLIGFEERAASLYLNFARRFVENRNLSWFWLEMSMEEKQHALFLQFCAGEQMILNLPDRAAIRKLDERFGSLEKRASQENLSVDEAFLIAAELEASEVNDIYKQLIGPVRGTLYIIKKKIQTLVPEHLQALIRGARKFHVSKSTMATLSELEHQEN
jgi:hypothetical protein